MADVAISKKPNAGYLSSFSFDSRSGYTFKFKWSFSSNATSTSKADRVQKIRFYYEYKNGADYTGYYSTSTASCSIKIPTDWKTTYLRVTPILYNSKGETICSSRKLTRSFTVAPNPTVSNVSFDYLKKQLTFTVGVSSAITDRPREETFYWVECYRLAQSGTTGIWKESDPVTLCTIDSTSTTSWTKTLTYSDLNLLDENTAYVFKIIANTFSMASDTAQAGIAYLAVTYPPKPQITGDSYTPSSGVELAFKWNKVAVDKNNPSSRIPYQCDSVTAQINYADDIKGIVEDNWSDVGSALVRGDRYFVDKTDITPSLGQRVFFRLRSDYMEHTRYSETYQLKNDGAFYKPSSGSETADKSVIEVTEVNTGSDGESLDVVIGYSADAKYNACELGYSKIQDAWLSTEQPSTYEMIDSYWKDSTSKSTEHNKTSSIKISGLDEATTYYVRARRYLVDDKDNVHSLWSEVKYNDTSYDQTKKIKLTAPSVVAVGKECSFSWSFEDGLTQKTWGLYGVGADGESDYRLTGDTNSLTASTYIFDTAGTYEVYIKSTFETLECYQSDPVTITVAEEPTVAFSTTPASTVTALPFSFTVKSNSTYDTSLQVKIYAYGASLWLPDGVVRQYAGDVVYQATGNNTLTCTLEEGCNLWDGCSYRIEVVGTANSLKSETLTHDFNVAYTSQLTPLTTDNIALTTDTDAKIATITLSNLSDNVTAMIYRNTKDERSQLIASGLKSNESIIDYFAPYAKDKTLSYEVVAKSPLNQYTDAECEYTMDGTTIRFDWNGESVEVPYNLKISDSNDKQFEQQVYLDGTQKGSWGASVVRTASLSTDTIYLKDAEVISKVRELARYQGAVFVRTPLGQAFCANVEVDEISKSYDSPVVAVSFNCTEIDLTDDYKAQKN